MLKSLYHQYLVYGISLVKYVIHLWIEAERHLI